jgi:Glycosyltransferase family 87
MAIKKTTAIVLLAAVGLSSFIFLSRLKNEMADFEVNYKAGQRIRGGETLYRTADGHWQFKYLPSSAFLYVPLTLVSLSAAKAVWFSVILLASIMIFVISSQLIVSKEKKFFSPAFFAALILARYFLRELQLGQINALITFLLVAGIWILVRSPRSPAGAAGGGLAGLAAALKPYAVIFLPYFILRKRWAAAGAGLAVIGLAIFAPVVFYGWRGNLVVLGEWRSSLAASTPALLASQDNVSLVGFLMKRAPDKTLAFVGYGIILAVLAWLVLYLLDKGKRVSRPAILEGFLLLALIPLISPLGWDYTFLSSAPAVMLICRHFDKYRRFWKGLLVFDFLVISLSLYDLLGRRLYADFMAASIITISFLALLGYLAYLRIRGYA